ncbi:MAG: tetratricopeptide repeat protein, partial [Cyclobacteriaceae bacterium]
MVRVIFNSFLTVLLFTSFTFAQTTNSSQLDYESAIRILNEGAYAEALEKFNKLIYSGFQGEEIYKYRGIAKFRLGDFKGAAEDLDKVRVNGDAEVEGLLGICKYKFQEWEASKYFLSKATSAGFSEGRGHLYLGYLYFNDRQYKEAVAQLNAAEKNGEKESQLYKIRGLAAYSIGDAKLAIQDLSKVLKVEKPSLEIYEALGLAYAEKNEFQAGSSYLQKADSMASKNNKVYFYLGIGLQENKNYSKAIAAYSKAIELNYTDEEIYINRGDCKIESGLIKESVMDFDFAIKLNPENTMAYRGRVAANLLLNDWARVVTDLAITNALGSFEVSDWGVLSEAKYALKNYQGALDEVNAALAQGTEKYTVGGTEHSFYMQQGKSLVALGKFDAALQAFNQVKESESSEELYLGRARAYVGLD